VIAFLDIKEMFVGPFPGGWDPTLLFVVAGALAVALLGFALTPYASVRPWFMTSFMLSKRRSVDGRLVAGALIFGVGWGLSGYSPATALASLLTGQIDTVIFVLAMLPGMWLAGKF
ncbi:MAG: YeeE/YedE family protein, partial [Rhodoferax sp.]|nr:YeeE/YedE family protein [Rhodoferax sp.]